MGVFQKNKNWFIDYRLPNGKRRRGKVETSKKLALNVLAKRKLEIAEGKFLDVKRNEKIKFDVFADEYLELHSKINNKSWIKSDLRNITALKKSFSGRYLYEISPHLIEQFKAERARQVKPSTVNRNLACLKTMFNKAKTWGRFSGDNPVKAVKFFKENNQRIRFLEKDEITRLLANCNKHLRPMVVISLNTGIRQGELLNLKWRDVDYKREIIYLHNTKNGETREIPVNEKVKTALIRVRRNPTSEYIFCKENGEHFKYIRTSFFTALKKSGIKDFHWHDLRHTFASHLVMSGVDLNTVRELLGHKSLKMTLRYSHLSQSHKKRAVDVLSKKMDTFWTPDTNTKRSTRKQELASI